VILGIQKQPGANTLDLTEQIDVTLDDIQRALPRGMHIHRDLFRQADFIEQSLNNLFIRLLEGAGLVVLVVVLFLMNGRAAFITLLALPLSLLAAVVVMHRFGLTINTMSLGGLAIAIGELVDDAIIDVENVARRLRENATRSEGGQLPVLEIVYRASTEIRSSVVFATVIVALVFLPLFTLGSVEGRLLRPLGFAYVVALAASLLVALTVTPVLCSWLLPRSRMIAEGHEPRWTQSLNAAYESWLRRALPWWRSIVTASVALFVAALAGIAAAGRSFLPEFNEGALTVGAVTIPGISLQDSNALGNALERLLLSVPEVTSTGRRTGRAELDEHAQGVEAAEIDVGLKMQDRSKEELLQELRRALTVVPGMNITIGQPISHRIDHMLSGTRANIAVKIFGDDLRRLRAVAQEVRDRMAKVPGVVDLSIEQQTDIPILRVQFDRDRIARAGLKVEEVAEAVETAFLGKTVSRVLEGQRSFDLVVRAEEANRQNLEAVRATLIDTPLGGKVPLALLAEVKKDLGPNTISREDVQRKIVVSSNVAGRDLQSVVRDIQQNVTKNVALPRGYYVEYGGQFESAEEASQTIGLLSLLVIGGIVLLLTAALRSLRDALIILVNLPLALIGGIFGIFLSGGVLSVASLIGLITLFGIAARNGIMMVSHIRYLIEEEGESFEGAVERGALERLSPILMTALCAGLALLPLVLRGGEPGSEILTPMAIVILAGLFSSTALNMIVVPALYLRFGRPVTEKGLAL
jgi:CzcA family heavy metal efflux pump